MSRTDFLEYEEHISSDDVSFNMTTLKPNKYEYIYANLRDQYID